MLGAAPHGLHRSPHVPVPRNQLPTCRYEITGLDAASGISRTWSIVAAVGQHNWPYHITVAFHNCVCTSQLASLFRIKRCMNPPENDVRSPLTSDLSNFVAPKGIRGVDADANDIATLDDSYIHGGKRFVDQNRIAGGPRGRAGEHIEPAGRNDCRPERDVARIYKVNSQLTTLQHLVAYDRTNDASANTPRPRPCPAGKALQSLSRSSISMVWRADFRNRTRGLGFIGRRHRKGEVNDVPDRICAEETGRFPDLWGELFRHVQRKR